MGILKYLIAMFSLKCNHCREGKMFLSKHAYQKGFMKMPKECPSCKHPLEPEPGFYWGTGYTSYALAVLFSGISFFVGYFTIGYSIDNYNVFYWLAINAVLLFVLQPPLMRFSRALYYSLFVPYNKDWRNEK